MAGGRHLTTFGVNGLTPKPVALSDIGVNRRLEQQ